VELGVYNPLSAFTAWTGKPSTFVCFGGEGGLAFKGMKMAMKNGDESKKPT